MELHEELLDEAKRLGDADGQPPSQARLRRAVSTAYYALYHLLVHEATSMFAADEALRSLICRAFVHSEMRAASKAFVGMKLPREIVEVCGDEIPKELQRVARTFNDLQAARHDADYKLNLEIDPNAAGDHIKRVEEAFRDWEAIRDRPLARIYLASLLLGKKWKHDDR